MNQVRTIRLPIHICKEINVYRRAAWRLQQELNRPPSTEEIAGLLDREPKDVDRILAYQDQQFASSTVKTDDGDRSVLDLLPDESVGEDGAECQARDINSLIESWLERLPEKQREVVLRRFGLKGHDPATLEQVGAAIGVTRERIRQIQLEALSGLHRLLELQGLEKEAVLG